LKTVDEEASESHLITQTCADIDKIVPSLLGVSKVDRTISSREGLGVEDVLDTSYSFTRMNLTGHSGAQSSEREVRSALRYYSLHKSETLLALKGCRICLQWFDEIRKLKNEKVNDLKTMRIDLQHLRTHRSNAVKLQAQIDQIEKEITDYNDQMAEIESEIQVYCGSFRFKDRVDFGR